MKMSDKHEQLMNDMGLSEEYVDANHHVVGDLCDAIENLGIVEGECDVGEWYYATGNDWWTEDFVELYTISYGGSENTNKT